MFLRSFNAGTLLYKYSNTVGEGSEVLENWKEERAEAAKKERQMPAQQRLARLHRCFRPRTAAAGGNSVENWSFSSLSLSIRPLSLEQDIMVGTAFHPSNEERQRVDDAAAEAMVAVEADAGAVAASFMASRAHSAPRSCCTPPLRRVRASCASDC